VGTRPVRAVGETQRCIDAQVRCNGKHGR
jgi:hypothetical protein